MLLSFDLSWRGVAPDACAVMRSSESHAIVSKEVRAHVQLVIPGPSDTPSSFGILIEIQKLQYLLACSWSGSR